MNKIIAILALFFMNEIVAEQHKIIFFVSPPRSLSVAFLRMMQARGDFQIMHEPSIYPFHMIHWPSVHAWFRKDALDTFDKVKEKIISESQTKPVFIKDMSFALRDFIIDDIDLLSNPNVYFVFLVRNPHHSVISFYKKCQRIAQAEFCRVISYESLYDIFLAAKKNNPNKPLILFSEDLYENPRKVIELFCDHVGILFKEEALHWQNLGDNFEGQEWYESKFIDHFYHWHGDALNSTHIGKPATYDTDENGNPTFNEIVDNTDRQICIGIWKTNMTYYNKLKELAL